MGYQVRVLNTTHVQPAQSVHPAHVNAGDHKLSFLDVIHTAVIPIQRLFFFDGPDLPPFPSVVGALRASLAATLAVFLPLAGTLAFRPCSGDVVIDCSLDAVSSPGVEFVEAEFSGSSGDMRRLAGDAEHDAGTFARLVPEIDLRQLPARVLAVQVTRPAVSGDGDDAAVAVGVSVLHAAVDGQAVWQFMRAWAAAARQGGGAPGLLVTPTFDRAAVRHPNSEELSRSFLSCVAPALPLLRSPSPSSTVDITRQSRRTFVLSEEQIRTLKRCIMAQSSSAAHGRAPTTYVAVSSLVWTSMVRARSLSRADEVHFMVTADCRRRLKPPLGEGFFGNCVKPCLARARAGDLLRGGGRGLARAAAAIRRCIRESLEEPEDPLSDIAHCVAAYRAAAGAEERLLTVVGSSHRFRAYETTDFGWGAPSRVELVSMFTREMVALLGARGGGVQVSVALDRARMQAFVENFIVPDSGSPLA
ncbi:hypothetical protein ACP4OV_027041 [Aristida adscensionis]